MPAFFRSHTVKAWSTIGLIFLAFQVSAQSPSSPAKAQTNTRTAQQVKKWDADEATRRTMLSIRQTLTAKQAGIDAHQLKAEDYRQLAQAIDTALADLGKSNTQSKDAAKAFHLVVQIDLSHSLELMRSAATLELQRVGALGVRQALRNYGEYFQHPGWV